MADDQPSRKDDKDSVAVAGFFLSTGIIVLSTVAGWLWGGVISNSRSAPYSGALGGFLAGIILVMTARLAATK